MDDELDVVADCLRGDRIVGVVGHRVVLRRGGRRGEVVDERDQLLRPDLGDAEIERLQHRDEPVAGLLELLVADTLGGGDADRDDHLVMAGVERRVGRAGLPDETVEPFRPVAGNRLIDPALDVARREPWRDDPADAWGREVQHLEAGAGRQAFGKERAEYLAGALVRADQRGHRKDEPLRARVDIEPARRIVDPVGQPVRQHVEHQRRARLLGMLGVAEQPAEHAVDDRVEPLGHHFGSSSACAGADGSPS